MKKTRITSLIMALVLVLTLTAALFTVAASADGVTVYVTVSNGTLMLTSRAVSVTDVDGDGALTINDALVLAHDAAYEGGSYGLAITKLWGVENGGSYGYYVNDKSAMGLTDKVSDGDRINAFVYTDTVGFSDVYCYFDNSAVTAAAGEKVTLTLLSAGYDANWQPVVNPVAGATVTVDGKSTELKTDADGKVTVTFDAEGTHTVSAVSDTARLVPPVCVATVTAASAPVTGDNAAIVIVVAAMAFAVMSVAAVRRKKADEE